MFVYILLLIVIIIFLKYLYLIHKRLCLLRKIGKQTKNHNGSMCYSRNPMISVFKRDAKDDISLQLPKKTIDISVITTAFRRVRYHFDINNKILELIIERRALYMAQPRRPRPAAVMDRVYVIRKYRIDLENSNKERQKYVILNPAPRSVSKADKATLVTLCDNDDLISGVKVCGLKWFIENIFDEQ